MTAWVAIVLVIIQDKTQVIPATGTPVAQFAAMDSAAREFMEMIGCQAAVVAVSKDGRVLYSRGLGWRDAVKKQQTPPDAIFRIASVTKPITAAAIKKLIREDKLSMDTKVFELLDLKPTKSAKPDPRLNQITIAHLLEHKAGWDAKKSFDPMFRPREIEHSLELRQPAKPNDVIRYMLGEPLQNDPGEKRAYSNFGFCVLGRVIEKVSAKPFAVYVHEAICKPLGLDDIKAARNAARNRDPREVWYPVNDVRVELIDASGGLIASAPALCKILDHFWINGDPRLPNQNGNWAFFGSLPGTTAMARQRTDGYNVVVLCNGRRDKRYEEDHELLKRLMDDALDQAAAERGK